MALEACIAADELAKQGIQVEVIDQDYSPASEASILNSVKNWAFNLLLIPVGNVWVQQWWGGSTSLQKKAFSLKAPVWKFLYPDCPAPVSWKLEQYFVSKSIHACGGCPHTTQKGSWAAN